MEHWGIYLAYAWMGTIILGLVDAVRAIRKGPQPQAQPLRLHGPSRLDP
jgi:hypothetical protein